MTGLDLDVTYRIPGSGVIWGDAKVGEVRLREGGTHLDGSLRGHDTQGEEEDCAEHLSGHVAAVVAVVGLW